MQLFDKCVVPPVARYAESSLTTTTSRTSHPRAVPYTTTNDGYERALYQNKEFQKMANRLQYNYYSNPAFSQQSEFYNGVPLSQLVQNIRQSPVGAQTPLRYLDTSPRKHQPVSDDGAIDEQEFYEEMLVDDCGIIKEKKVVVVSSPSQEKPSRYEYIPMQEQTGRYIVCQKQSPIRAHRYELIETTNNDHLARPSHRYEYIQDDYSPKKTTQGRYEYIEYEPPSPAKLAPQRPPFYGGNPIATQKLHELLSTPKKTPTKTARPVFSPQSQRKFVNPSPSQQDPFLTPKKPQKVQYAPKSRAQQRLNYAIAARQAVPEKRHTAVVAPMCSSPIQSVYSETTYSQKSVSWMNLGPRKPVQVTLALAAVILTLCGSVTSGLCFYMISIMGRQYFLDFGVVAGFTCLVLGMLGFRTRRCCWLPNRNYISGYIVLSLFSLMMCMGLVLLMVLQPKPGTPLADMTSGAVCGISVLSLLLASVGVITSYCCKYPPPDNRVEHSVPGFTV